MGGGKSKTPPPSKAEQMSAEISKRLFTQTDPLRNEFLKMYGSLFGLEPTARPMPKTTTERFWDASTGEMGTRTIRPPADSLGTPEYDWQQTGRPFNPASVPGYDAMFRMSREGIGGQYDLARDAILAGTPRGGAQVQGLTDVEIGRAKDVSGTQNALTASIIDQLFTGGQAAVSGGATGSLQGLSSAGAMAAQRQQAALQSQSASNQGKKNAGMALGLMAATGGMGAPAAGAMAAGGGVALNPANYSLGGPFVF